MAEELIGFIPLYILGVAIKCKQYSEITVDSWTHGKIVQITLNIFGVHTKTVVQCLVSYLGDPEKFSMVFSIVFQANTGKKLQEKKSRKKSRDP